MAEPKCPSCGAVGIDNIVSDESNVKSKAGDAWFEVAYCEKCGHVYGVFPKVVLEPTKRVPQF